MKPDYVIVNGQGMRVYRLNVKKYKLICMACPSYKPRTS